MKKIRSFINNHKKNIYEFFKFGIVGGINTGISFGIYFVLINYTHIYYVICSAIAYVLGIFSSYMLNSVFVFKQDLKAKFGFKFSMVYLSSLFINMVLLYFIVEIVGFHKLFGQIITTGIVMVYNYLLIKCWAFLE